MKLSPSTPNFQFRSSMMTSSMNPTPCPDGGVSQRIAAFELHSRNASSKNISKTSSSFVSAPLKNVKNIISKLESGLTAFQNLEQKKTKLLSTLANPATTHLVRPSKFRHIYSVASASLPFPPEVAFLLNVKPILRVNHRFCALGVGHQFYVFEWRTATGSNPSSSAYPVPPTTSSNPAPTTSFGPAATGFFSGVKLLDLQWNSRWPDILAISGTGGEIQTWKCVVVTQPMQESQQQQQQLPSRPPFLTRISSFRHSKDAHFIRWHPTASEILLAVLAPDHKIIFWNSIVGSQIAEIDAHPTFIGGIAWSNHPQEGGCLVTAAKDGIVRVFDCSAVKMATASKTSVVIPAARQFRAHGCCKAFDITVLKDGRVFTSGLTQSSMREIALWQDPTSLASNFDEPLFRETVSDQYSLYLLKLRMTPSMILTQHKNYTNNLNRTTKALQKQKRLEKQPKQNHNHIKTTTISKPQPK